MAIFRAAARLRKRKGGDAEIRSRPDAARSHGGFGNRKAFPRKVITSLLTPLRRRAWALPAAVVGVTLVAYLAAGIRPDSPVAEAVLVVSSGASQGDPGDAGEAEDLAATYAGLIPEDRGVLSQVSRSVELPTSSVEDRLSVLVDQPPTALLRVQFEGTNRETALAGADAAAYAVSGSPMSAAIPPQAVTVVRPAHLISESSPSPASTIPIGLVLGLLLGLLLVLALERADPRVDDVATLGSEVDAPASSLEIWNREEAAALLARWQAFVRKSPSRIALVPAVPSGAWATEALVELLMQAGDGQRADSAYASSRSRKPNVRVSSSGGREVVAGGPGGSDVTLVVSGAPTIDAAGELSAYGADLIVLVVPKGLRAAELRASIGVLETVGLMPGWALLVGEAYARRPGAGEAPGRASRLEAAS
jgi:capsular polysaccharide biosynthesis protein